MVRGLCIMLSGVELLGRRSFSVIGIGTISLTAWDRY